MKIPNSIKLGMRTNRIIVLLGFCGVLAGVCIVVVFLIIHHQGPGVTQVDTSSAHAERVAKSREVDGAQDRSSQPNLQTAIPIIDEVSVDLDSALRAALAEKDPSLHKELLRQRALTDPKQVSQWVGQFPEGAAREQALQGLISIWVGQDANGVAQWLQSLRQTPSRDVAISAFSGTVADQFPAIAFQWAATIPDSTLRCQQLENVAGTWLKQDPTTAQQNIALSSLPQDIKSRLLK